MSTSKTGPSTSTAANPVNVQYNPDTATLTAGTVPLFLGGALGPYVDVPTLQAANPAALNAGKHALVGAGAPYVDYISTGSGWVTASSVGNPSATWGITATPDALTAYNFMATPPTVVMSAAGAATSIANPVTIANNDARIGYSPSTPSGGVMFWTTPGTYIGGNSQYIGVQTDSADLEFVVQCSTANTKVCIRVNGQFVSATQYAFPAGGQTYRLRVTFTSKKLRTVEITGGIATGDTVFQGLTLNATDTINLPPKTTGELWACVGDSMTFGIQGPSDSGGGSLTSVCMTALGIKNYLTYGQQGGGYCAPNNTQSVPVQAPTAIFGYPITRFLIVLGYNDWQYSFAASQIQTAAAAFYDAIHAQFPNAKIYAVTALNEVNGGDNASLGIAAAVVGRPWVSLIKAEGNYLSGTGHVGATTGIGNADFVTAVDAIHPAPYGHTYYGLRIAQDLLALRAVSP